MSYTQGHTSLSYGLGAAPAAKADMSAFQDPRQALVDFANVLASPSVRAMWSPVAANYAFSIQTYIDGAKNAIATSGKVVAGIEGAVAVLFEAFAVYISVAMEVGLGTAAGTTVTVGGIVSAVESGVAAGGSAAAGATGPFAIIVMVIVVAIIILTAIVMGIVGKIRADDLERQAKNWAAFRTSLVTQMLPKPLAGFTKVRPADLLLASPGTPTERSFRHGNEGGEPLTVESESITGTVFRALENITAIPAESRAALRTMRSLVAWSRASKLGGAEVWPLYVDLIAYYWKKGIITPTTWGAAWLKLIRPYGWDGRGNPLGPNQAVEEDEWKRINEWAGPIAALFAQVYADSKFIEQGVPDFVVQAKVQPSAKELWANIGPDASVTTDVNGGDWLAIDQRPLFLAFKTVEDWSKKFPNAKPVSLDALKASMIQRGAMAAGAVFGMTKEKLARAQACKAKGGKAKWNFSKKDYDCLLPAKPAAKPSSKLTRDPTSSANAGGGGLLAALLLVAAGGAGYFAFKRAKRQGARR